MIFQWLSGFITFTLEIKQFHLFIFFRFLCILFHLTKMTVLLYFIVDTYVKSQISSLAIRETNLYWPTLSRIGRFVLSVSQRQFSSYLCKYHSSWLIRIHMNVHLDMTSYQVLSDDRNHRNNERHNIAKILLKLALNINQ